MVVVGNGFDVALGFKTRYGEFYANSKDLRQFAQNGNLLCQHILTDVQSDLWSDLEAGLWKYSQKITSTSGSDNIEEAKRFETEFNELRVALFNYLNSISGEPIECQKQAAAMGLSIEWHVLQPKYLTFNYSSTTANTLSLNGRYILNGDDSINEDRFVFQHGNIYDTHTTKLRSPEDIVLGIDAEEQPVEELHRFLYKTEQRLRNIGLTLDEIRQKQFYVVYGCSVGESDATYFKHIFSLDQKGKIFLIYGYGEGALNSIKQNIEKFNGNLGLFCKNNSVVFLDVMKVADTRQITKEIISEYMTSIANQ